MLAVVRGRPLSCSFICRIVQHVPKGNLRQKEIALSGFHGFVVSAAFPAVNRDARSKLEAGVKQ